MLSGRKIKRKIRSVQNIKKITRAMEMVSAAKFKRVWTKLTAIRPYSSKLKGMTENLLANLKTVSQATGQPVNQYLTQYTDRPADPPDGREGQQTHRQSMCIIAVAASKGLCGGYNTNMVKALAN
ncbi:MAG: FoF1 ATP synthase subunit gamma, partial [Planctomycetota bacterium]